MNKVKDRLNWLTVGLSTGQKVVGVVFWLFLIYIAVWSLVTGYFTGALVIAAFGYVCCEAMYWRAAYVWLGKVKDEHIQYAIDTNIPAILTMVDSEVLSAEIKRRWANGQV